MNQYAIGDRIIARVTWDGKTKYRNCRVAALDLLGPSAVNVWSNWTQTYYTDQIPITPADICPMSIMAGLGPRRHTPFVPDPP